jgi:hypothetical protein
LAIANGFPQPMQAPRHDIVHQVVTLRHRVENIRNALRLLAFGDFLKTEMGRASIVHRSNSKK